MIQSSVTVGYVRKAILLSATTPILMQHSTRGQGGMSICRSGPFRVVVKDEFGKGNKFGEEHEII